MNKKFIFILVAIIIFIGAVSYFAINRKLSSPLLKITNFEECARAGYPVGESYPRQCWTPDGKHFVEQLTIEETKELLSQFLLTQAGIVGVGIGECEGEPCIKVMLEKELKNLPNLKDQIPSKSHDFKVVTEVTGVICTQEAKVCPDGSTVGRTGPNCEFAPCP